ncbi:hypothetical protein GWI33_022411 [Rhynchophorus ferrugineus]|uniref:C-type lectin domain-containing protein n=1 Tax=Rhynchophorus ferrugineus TaxID=354439 RepID=A0A834ML52_RHYFE|nr:hypothetical protein GWI33_022411 [Rhynchophorus ferrugineus]
MSVLNPSIMFVIAVAVFFGVVQSRAVNISNTWMLPEEGFPVFYRYFRDRISWYEADAVCQFHHANLVTGLTLNNCIIQKRQVKVVGALQDMFHLEPPALVV